MRIDNSLRLIAALGLLVAIADLWLTGWETKLPTPVSKPAIFQGHTIAWRLAAVAAFAGCGVILGWFSEAMRRKTRTILHRLLPYSDERHVSDLCLFVYCVLAVVAAMFVERFTSDNGAWACIGAFFAALALSRRQRLALGQQTTGSETGAGER